jgi:hypothetical protein
MLILTRLSMVGIGLAVTGAAWAQEPANALASFQQNAARRESEWVALTTNLEQRLARLLPCDPRIRRDIAETSRASEARIAALTTYWMAVSRISKGQLDAIQRLATEEEAHKGESLMDGTEADQEHATVIEENGFLAVGAGHSPDLGSAQKALAAATQSTLKLEAQVRERRATREQLLNELQETIKAAGARQSAIEAEIQAISAEGLRWNAYYAARIARAQTECTITNPEKARPRPARKTTRKRKAAPK